MIGIKLMQNRKTPVLWFACGICIGLFPYLCNFLDKESDTVNEDIVCINRSFYLSELTKEGKRNIPNSSSKKDIQKSNPLTGHKQQRKILLDCGANVASTVLLFRETYPDGEDYIIHSFEIDDRLAPYFASYKGVNIHCPLGVSNVDGHMTAYSETPWSPNKGLNNGKDMHWGGGTLYVSKDEKTNNKTGGKRLLSHRKQIPVVDLSQWIQNNTSPDDYVIFKLDVEGAEFGILEKMLKDGTFKWIDKMYGEYHYSQPHGWDKKGINRIKAAVKEQGFEEVDWAGEHRYYGDFKKLHPVTVTKDIPGKQGQVYSTCQPKDVALTVAVGMNYKRAQRLIDTITAYATKVPVMLFFYGDFVQQFPDAVLRWSHRFDVGIREDANYPLGHFEIMAKNWIKTALVASEMKFLKLGLRPAYYLPAGISRLVTHNAKSRGWRIVRPLALFPPPLTYPVTSFNLTNYYTYRDVERIPKALRVIYQQLKANEGGVLALDSDLPDSFLNIVFLLDYFVRASEFTLVDMDSCVI